MQNKGLSGKVKVVAFDATETAIEMLTGGTVDMVIAQKPSDMGYLATQMAVAYLDGATSIPAHFMIAQAALETGWGRSELRFADGAPTHNLFGIKAGRNWQGAVAEATTTEYVNGVAQKSVERFRAYASYGEAFRDYANLLASNPRYAEVLNPQDAAGFARGLQRAGYATDPMYAAKLERIIGGAALRDGMSG